MSETRHLAVKVVDRIEDLAAVETNWDDLVSRSRSAYPFLTLEWLRAWWDFYGQGRKLFILVALDERDSNPVGIAPFMVTRKAGFRVLEFIGTGISDYLDIIVADRRDDVLRAFLDFLKARTSSWDLIWLGDLAAEESNSAALAGEAIKAGWRARSSVTNTAPFISIRDSWEKYLSEKGGHFNRVIKQKEKRLAREGRGFEVRLVTAGWNQELFDHLIEVEKKSWKWGAYAQEAERSRNIAFRRKAFASFAGRGWLNLWLGSLGERPIAWLVNFDFNNKILCYANAFDKTFGSYSPGSVLLAHALEDAFRRNKVEFDFLRGEEVYKNRWTSERRDLRHLLIWRRTPRSAGAVAAVYGLWRNLGRAARFARQVVRRRITA